MKLEPTEKDFFSNVEKEYGNQVITPCEEIGKFLEKISSIYPLERVPVRDVLPELINYLNGKNLSKSEYEVFAVMKDESTMIFFDFNKQRKIIHNSIYLLFDKKTEEFISNCVLLQLKVTILRGINQTEVINNTSRYKNYLNAIYLFESACEKMKGNQL